MLCYKVVAGRLTWEISRQSSVLLDADVEAREGTQEGAQLDHASKLVACTVYVIFRALHVWPDRYLFRTYQHQYPLTVLQGLLRWNVQGVVLCLAKALRRRGQYTVKLITAAHEAGGEDSARVAVNLLRLVKLFDPALCHNRNPIGDRQRLLLVMRHINGSHLKLLLDSAELVAQRDAHLGIERVETFVEHEHLWFDRPCAGQGSALLLAS